MVHFESQFEPLFKKVLLITKIDSIEITCYICINLLGDNISKLLEIITL